MLPGAPGTGCWRRSDGPGPPGGDLAVNAAIDGRRALRQRQEQPFNAAAVGLTLQDATALVDHRDLLLRALSSLPPKQRILAAHDARQACNDQRAAAGLPPKTRRRRRRTLASLAAAPP